MYIISMYDFLQRLNTKILDIESFTNGKHYSKIKLHIQIDDRENHNNKLEYLMFSDKFVKENTFILGIGYLVIECELFYTKDNKLAFRFNRMIYELCNDNKENYINTLFNGKPYFYTIEKINSDTMKHINAIKKFIRDSLVNHFLGVKSTKSDIQKSLNP